MPFNLITYLLSIPILLQIQKIGMELYFGMAYDDAIYHREKKSYNGTFFLGPQGVLHFLLSNWGIQKPPIGSSYLRLEQYRQAIKATLENPVGQVPFYKESYLANPFAVASNLLESRDELFLGGWDFKVSDHIPLRLEAMAHLEDYFQEIITTSEKYYPGTAELWDTIFKLFPRRHMPFNVVYCHEPQNGFPVHINRLFTAFKNNGVEVKQLSPETIPSNTDLGQLKALLTNPSQFPDKLRLGGDGSLILLKGTNEAQLARFVAQTISLNPSFCPSFLIPGDCKALDDAFIQEGVPSFGIKSSSLARPSMQVLKLVTLFLWKPIDPYKLLEFVSLQIKPLNDLLASRMADFITQKPGIKGEGWYAMVNQAFHDIEMDELYSLEDQKEAKFQYNFWFERALFDSNKKAPKSDVIAIFEYLEQWAQQLFKDRGEVDDSILMVSLQAKQTRELLQVLAEDNLSPLEVERIIMTIYDPTFVQFKPLQKDHYPYVSQPNALMGNQKQLIWWNFIDDEIPQFFSRWYTEELNYLDQMEVAIDTPVKKNQWINWKRKWPIFRTNDQLILCIPSKLKGSATLDHALLGNLEAGFSNLDSIIYSLDEIVDPTHKVGQLEIPQKVILRKIIQEPIAPFLKLDQQIELDGDRIETPTSLETLLYYPYKWFFKHYLKINKSPVLGIMDDARLLGSLAHRFIEEILEEESVPNMNQKDLERRINQLETQLLPSEGAVLLMYGKEAERVGFLNTLKFSTWKLVTLIKSNNWKILGKEYKMEGGCYGIPLKGRADLVLDKSDDLAIIDLKWRGLSFRKQMIKNEEDVQLVLYAHLLRSEERWPNTAFYIIEKGQMLSRNNQAFKEISGLSTEGDHEVVNDRIFGAIGETLNWRKEQLERGWVEIRCEETSEELESYYGARLLDVLEMKKEDAAFDDYKVLIYGVQ